MANSFPERIIALSSLPIGTIIRMNYDGSLEDFIVVQIGLPSAVYDTSCDGIWIMSRYIPVDWVNDYHTGYYPNTVFHSYMNSTYLNKFDAGVRNIIKSVKIPCTYYDNDQKKEISLNLQCKAFAPSMEELGFPESYLANMCRSGSVL